MGFIYVHQQIFFFFAGYLRLALIKGASMILWVDIVIDTLW